MKRELDPNLQSLTPPDSNSMTATAKAKMCWEDEAQSDCGVDELLAVLGYQVRSSDMAEVAQKLELLNDLMGNAHGDGLSQLASDTVHYNPSDLSTWLQSILSDFNPLPVNVFDPMVPHATGAVAAPAPLDDSLLAPAESSTITSIDFDQQNSINHTRVFEDSSSSDYDLKAISKLLILANQCPSLSSSLFNDIEKKINVADAIDEYEEKKRS